MNSETLANKIQEQLQARGLTRTDSYTLAVEPVIKVTATYEENTDIDIHVCVKTSEVVISIYAEHNSNTLALQKRYFPDNEDNLATRIAGSAITSAILVQTM